MSLNYEKKLRAVAIAFMKDDPEEYQGDTLDEVIEQLRSCENPAFIDKSYEWFVALTVVSEATK